MTPAISEAASETYIDGLRAAYQDWRTKHKVGRPIAMPVQRFTNEMLGAPKRSPRQQSNIAYAQHAFGVLKHAGCDADPIFHWLCGPIVDTPGKFPTSVLAELGRFADADDIIEYAKQVCEIEPRMTAKDAVAALRLIRLGRVPA